jgi:hypothetical protein
MLFGELTISTLASLPVMSELLNLNTRLLFQFWMPHVSVQLLDWK